AMARVYGGKRRFGRATIFAIFGLCASIVGAVIAGSVPAGRDARSEMVIFAAPLASLFLAAGLWETAAGFWNRRRGHDRFFLVFDFGVGAAIVFAALLWPLPFYAALRAAGITSPGIVFLGLAIIALSFFEIVMGTFRALGQRDAGSL